MTKFIIIIFMLFGWVASGTAWAQSWSVYGGDDGGSHYSSLTQINRDNVADLELAWSYQTGHIARYPKRPSFFAGFHVTPLLLPEQAGRSLVLCTAYNRIIALDPTTGEERWSFDPEMELGPIGLRFNCRGIAYWKDGEASDGAACQHRLFMGTRDLRLVAVDARNGERCHSFGDNGEVNILPMVVESYPQFKRGQVHFSSPPAIVGDVVILGSSDNTKFKSAINPIGYVRAFDARTGALRWRFDPILRSSSDPETEKQTEDAPAPIGSANVWSMMSVDAERDLVFLPTATAGANFYGVHRPGDNRYANSVVALKGSTGEMVWHFQTLHHDVWDDDLPAQPILVDLEKDGQKIPVVIQLTKQSLIFVLHRETGEPIYPVEERPVPTNGIPGEVLSPTQPFPTAPPALGSTSISPDDAWGLTLWDKAECRQKIADWRSGDLYTPPTLQGTITPGISQLNWGGAAFDPASNILVAPLSRVPGYIRLIPLSEVDPDLLKGRTAGLPSGPPGRIEGTEYAAEFGPLLSSFGVPCTAPPWGELVAVDLGDATIKWRVPLGTLDKVAPFGMPLNWGTALAGGPIITGSGLIFIGATADEKFRAFDLETGKELWKISTPTASMATPMTYEVDGRQFVVIASGGHMWSYPQKIADYLVAYALPEN